jgi:type II secretory pathway pseudopilin PulG
VFHGHGTRTRLRAETPGCRAGRHFGVQARSRYFMGKKGFTLIEIIILIVMAGILLPTIIVPFVSAVKGSGKPEMVNTAMFLAQEKMEELTKNEYLEPPLDPISLTSYADIAGFSDYQWQWEILYVDSYFNVVGDGIQPSNQRGYKRILVRVKDPQNDTYEISSAVGLFPQ